MHIHLFFNYLEGSGEVSNLIYLDLSPSLLTLPCSQEYVHSKLSPIVDDRDVLNFLWSFITTPLVFNNEILEFAIPPVGLITDVLFNFFLDELDRTFITFIPEKAYSRYINACFIRNSDRILIENILSSFGLSAKMISLFPGCPPINCFGHSIRVREDFFMKRSEKGSSYTPLRLKVIYFDDSLMLPRKGSLAT